MLGPVTRRLDWPIARGPPSAAVQRTRCGGRRHATTTRSSRSKPSGTTPSTRARVTHPFLRHEWLRTWWDASARRRAAAHRDRPRRRPYRGDRAADARDGVDVRRPGAAPPASSTTITRRAPTSSSPTTPRSRIARSGARFATRSRALGRPAAQPARTRLAHARRRCATARRPNGCPTGTWKSSDSPYLTITGTWDDYLQRPVGQVQVEPAEPAVAAARSSATGRLEVLDRPRSDRGGALRTRGGSRPPAGSSEAGTAITSRSGGAALLHVADRARHAAPAGCGCCS